MFTNEAILEEGYTEDTGHRTSAVSNACKIIIVTIAGAIGGTISGALAFAAVGYIIGGLVAENSEPCLSEPNDHKVQQCGWLHSDKMKKITGYSAVGGGAFGFFAGAAYANVQVNQDDNLYESGRKAFKDGVKAGAAIPAAVAYCYSSLTE